MSGQHLTPVLVHGDRVVCDSAAILRYLEVTFRDAPGLLGSSRDEQWEIETWELFARAQLAGPMMDFVHARVARGAVDEAQRARCAASFAKATAELIERLEKRTWLVGDSMTAADIAAAPVLYRVQAAQMFEVPAEAASALAPWVQRVMSFDGPCREA